MAAVMLSTWGLFYEAHDEECASQLHSLTSLNTVGSLCWTFGKHRRWHLSWTVLESTGWTHGGKWIIFPLATTFWGWVYQDEDELLCARSEHSPTYWQTLQSQTGGLPKLSARRISERAGWHSPKSLRAWKAHSKAVPTAFLASKPPCTAHSAAQKVGSWVPARLSAQSSFSRLCKQVES